MTDQTYSSAVMRTLVGISQVTLQRYVRDFSTFLSPGAQIHQKGRRFTDRDVKTFWLIKRMHYSHSSHDQIIEALGKDASLNNDLLDLDAIGRLSQENNDALRKLVGKVDTLYRIVHDLDITVRNNKAILRGENLEVVKRFDQLKADIDNYIAKQPISNKGWFRR